MSLVYIVEDDPGIRELESYALQNINCRVRIFESAPPFYKALKKELPDLVILDIMLPAEDGLSILKKIRSNSDYAALPVMMVTAKSEEIDAVKGLDAGADDYIAKPFSVMIFLSRVKALLRRSKTKGVAEAHKTLAFENIILDEKKHTVFVDKEKIELTYKEFEILQYLLINQDIVVTRENLLNTIWGYTSDSKTRTIDSHILTLRKKLGQAGSHIKTVRNVGYKLGE